MSTVAGVGYSSSANARRAGEEAASKACLPLQAAPPDFCLVFGTSGYDQAELLAGIRSVTGAARLSGCTGEGIIAGEVSDERDRALGVLALRSDAFQLEPFLVGNYRENPTACGRELARQVCERPLEDALGLLLFPDGLVGNCTELLRALESSLPANFPVVGGSAGDAMLFERTWQYLDGEAHPDSVAAVLLRGRGELAIQVSHGCQTVGMLRTVSEADGGWLKKIDGIPAWDVFREYLDGNPVDLNAEGIAHLSLAEELETAASGEYGTLIIRTPLQLDQATGALFFPGGGIAEGTAVRMARRDQARIRSSARECAARILGPHAGSTPAFVMQFDCAGRGRILFGSCAAEEIVRPLQDVLGASVPWIGFHTYGEIAPIHGRLYYHNYTVALCAVYERPQ